MARIRSVARSDIGLVRQVNEDVAYAGAHLWAVADGMGGHAAGDVASEIVVSQLRTIDRPDLAIDDLVQAIGRANDEVVGYADTHPEARGLGSTVAGLAEVTMGGVAHWAVFNVGDSRVYRFFEGVLSRATTDHSEVEELVLAGRLTDAEARLHPLRHVITRSIGTSPAPQVDVWVLPQTAGERFLVCSDGLTEELDDAAIRDVLAHGDLDGVGDELVAHALEHGGRDNVSVVHVVVERPARQGGRPDGDTNPRNSLPLEEER